MKRLFRLALLAVALGASARAGIIYSAFTPNGTLDPGSGPVSSDATVSGFGSVLQSYVLTLTFSGTTVSTISGALTLTALPTTPFQSIALSSGWATTDNYTYTETFGPSTALAGYTPNTTWALALQNSSLGDNNSIVSWSLSEITAVPEPVNLALGIFAGVFLVVLLARSRWVRIRLHRARAAFVVWVNAV